jgi:UDP-N-acetylmuramoyl-tripeptide--D-alanyl-D-alanine ligase
LGGVFINHWRNAYEYGIICIRMSFLQKKLKNYVQQKMEGYVKAYFASHDEIKLVVVAGSVGKTSTKAAISTMLSQKYRIRVHDGNHNTEMSAPLAILGIAYPKDIRSIVAWQKVFHAAEARILQPPDVDIVIQELGADHPGDITQFGRYLRSDIAVITAVTPEHMEFFQHMEAVAREELAAANFADNAIINRDDIDGKYASFLNTANVNTYGTSGQAEYHFVVESFDLHAGYKVKFLCPEFGVPVDATVKVVGVHNLRPAVAAATVGAKLGLAPDQVVTGLSRIRPVPGRMQLLEGMLGSTIIDDSYNSSPAAAEEAIKTFLSLDAPQRIVILGSMSELGEMSPDEHEKLGHMFHPDNVDWVITIGEEAERYLAPAAHANGCQIKSFRNAVEAGGFAHHYLQPDALVLVKGSQNGIFTEEAAKVLLKNPEDMRLLVRQSAAWMTHKEAFFAQFEGMG